MPRGVFISDKRGRKSVSLEERLWTRVQRAANGCLEWQGGRSNGWCGCIGVTDLSRPNKVRMELVPRVAWEMVNGPIPSGMDVLHHCDNPLCCDVFDSAHHLYLGDHTQNMRERSLHGRHYCRLGIPTTPEIIQEIRRRSKAGELGKDLAKYFAMSPQNISLIINHQTWREPS